MAMGKKKKPQAERPPRLKAGRRDGVYASRKSQAEALHRVLLSHGGRQVANVDAARGLSMVAADPDLPLVAARGQYFAPSIEVRIARGAAACKCHEVASRNWFTYKSRVLVTGYALSRDGMWRSHTWTFNPRTRVIYEPTPLIRAGYFGVVLTEREAAAFASRCVC